MPIGSKSVHRGEAYLAYLAFLAQKIRIYPGSGKAGCLPIANNVEKTRIL